MTFIGGVVRAFFRLLALIFALLAAACAVFLVIVLTAPDNREWHSLARVWYEHDPLPLPDGGSSLAALHALVLQKLPAQVWDPLMVSILELPSAMALALCGVTFVLICIVLSVLTRVRR